MVAAMAMSPVGTNSNAVEDDQEAIEGIKPTSPSPGKAVAVGPPTPSPPSLGKVRAAIGTSEGGIRCILKGAEGSPSLTLAPSQVTKGAPASSSCKPCEAAPGGYTGGGVNPSPTETVD